MSKQYNEMSLLKFLATKTYSLHTHTYPLQIKQKWIYKIKRNFIKKNTMASDNEIVQVFRITKLIVGSNTYTQNELDSLLISVVWKLHPHTYKCQL